MTKTHLSTELSCIHCTKNVEMGSLLLRLPCRLFICACCVMPVWVINHQYHPFSSSYLLCKKSPEGAGLLLLCRLLINDHTSKVCCGNLKLRWRMVFFLRNLTVSLLNVFLFLFLIRNVSYLYVNLDSHP